LNITSELFGLFEKPLSASVDFNRATIFLPQYDNRAVGSILLGILPMTYTMTLCKAIPILVIAFLDWQKL
jgi:hypothetical protein